MEFHGFGGFREVLDLIFEVLKRSLGLAGWAGLADWVARHAFWLRCLAGWLIAAPRFLRPSQGGGKFLIRGCKNSTHSSLRN